MNDLLKKHPELKDTLAFNNAKTYKILSSEDELIEQWEKDVKGHWVDVTGRELLKIEIAKAQEALEDLRIKEKANEKTTQ